MDSARDGPAMPAPHRVGRLRFEIGGNDEATLLRLRGAIVGGAESWIPAALDTAFAAHDRPGRTIHIHRLEIDLGLLPDDGMTPELLTAMVRASLARRLRALAPGEPAPRVTDEAAGLAAALCFFLRHGRLPWWGVIATVAELELSILGLDLAALSELARAGAAILAQVRGARRLVLQLAPQAAARLAAALPGAKPGDFDADAWPAPADQQAVEALAARVRRAAGQTAGDDTARDGSTRDDVEPQGDDTVDEIADRAARAETARVDEGEQEEDALREAALDSAIAVVDAGLVLLHPFLAALFEARGLAAGGRFAGDAAQQRAVQLTGWLAGGEVAPREPELVMAKLLCGWPLDDPLPRDAGLSEADCAEGEAMLRAVIGHWSALGKASPSALRETFLTRPGRLSQGDRAWRLEVERRGTDVLLERLPWALNPLRLPWMARPLVVDWG